MKKFTIDDVRNYLLTNDVNNTCTLLSTEYLGSKSPLKFRCNQCGKEFERCFSNVRRNTKFTCARCSQDRFLKISDVLKYLNEVDTNHECTLLSTKYENYYKPLLFKCNICGEEFTRSFSQVKQIQTYRCYKCAKKIQGGYNKKSVKDIQLFINEYDINHDCELLSTEYIDQYTPLLFKCNCCGEQFERSFSTMRAKKAFKCFRCAHHLPPESESDAYQAMKNYFRGKLYTWKKEILLQNPVCDISGSKKDLEVHHLNNFVAILQQAAENTDTPLNIFPWELNDKGYSLSNLENEFIKLHNQFGKAVVLNKEIHTLFHKMYGYKCNTPQQYEEFKEKYKKGELGDIL